MGDLMVEFYQDLYEELEELEQTVEEGGSPRQRERLTRLRRILGEAAAETEDDLVAQWEADLAAGRVPDLEMTPEQLRQKKG